MEMEFEGGEEEVVEFPVSPSGQYLNSSVFSLAIFGVLEFQVPIHDLPISLINDLFLPINPRFSSVMVGEKNGVKKWRPVTVNLKDHVFVPKFPEGLSPEEYDEYVNEYISKKGMEQLPQSKPLWEIHRINYPTSNAAASLIFKLHHSLGDGYSLMGALLSCLQRVDNPSLPLTFPSRQLLSNPNPNSLEKHDIKKFIFFPKTMFRLSSTIMTSVLDFGRSLLRSSVVGDDLTPIRSASDGVEFRPLAITTMAFSLHHIKQIKDKLKVTVNDVMTGVILLGIRLYMKGESNKSTNTNTTSTALVLLNTRNIDGYKSVSEMVKPKATMPWGNHFAFLHVPIPKLSTSDCSSNPLDFVFNAHDTIKRLRNNYAAVLSGQFIEICRKLKGAEATAKYIHKTLRNSSLSVSNIIGPVEQMALANHPVKGLYFIAVGIPQSLTIALVSYVETLRATIAVEKGFIDPLKLKSCIQVAYDMIFQAALPTVSC